MHEVVPWVVAIAVSIVIAAMTNMGTVSAYNSGHGGICKGYRLAFPESAYLLNEWLSRVDKFRKY
jgi:hypothetical protein